MVDVYIDNRYLSLILCEVLSDIGVNEEVVLRRRNCALLEESLDRVNTVMNNGDISLYLFGSQSEGTTTTGLNSDVDELFCHDSYHVIPKRSDWKPDVANLLMVQDETTAPGYCHLQLLRDDEPHAFCYIPGNDYCEDSKGRICMKNTKFHNAFIQFGNIEQHGPAVNVPESENVREQDAVPAFHCKCWPTEGRHWLNRRSASGWPTIELKTESERSGCFLVPVGSKINGLNELEWRISTSQAERLLMFSLNITHLSSYVLIKMLLKSHINRGCDNVISSYMCKTAMLHCVERTSNELWCEHNLILCLNQILQELYNYVLDLNCPHFIIPENNLMAERIMPEQQQMLLGNIQQVINSDGRVLFEINTDDIGTRLQLKLNIAREFPINIPSSVLIRRRVSGQLMYNIALAFCQTHVENLRKINNIDNIEEVTELLLCYNDRYKHHYSRCSELEQEAYRLLSPLLFSTMCSVQASCDIMLNRAFSDIASEWSKSGLASDISSSRLKLATVYYRKGDMIETERLLRYVEQFYDMNVVQPVCGCYVDHTSRTVPGFDAEVDKIGNEALRNWVSYCVMFARCEVNIVPHEMQQEYNRSTEEEIRCRSNDDNDWMNFAVVDSLPYLYFLQYKTYGRLRNHIEQQTALQNLEHVIRDGRNMFHKETACNLLGQCMEQENRLDEAIHCYESSFLIRPNNNAAQFHRVRMYRQMFAIDETVSREKCCRQTTCCIII